MRLSSNQEHDSQVPEIGDPRVSLYHCDGIVHTLRSFAGSRLSLLSELEAEIICNNLESFPDSLPDKQILQRCLTRSIEFSSNQEPVVEVLRSGARSAYWESEQIKLKGCRPVRTKTVFPVDTISFDSREIKRQHTAFGVLDAQGVMRELLGYCFFCQIGLPVISKPLCVFEYLENGKNAGYCLVLETPENTRIESLIDYPDITIYDLLTIYEKGGIGDGKIILGSELRLSGLNIWRYAEEKAAQLCAMHFAGGFRGILNSNIGNDISIKGPSNKFILFLCDFDTFEVKPVSARLESSEMDIFVLRCIIEVAMGAMPILEFVDIPENCTIEERTDLLGYVFFEKSTLWRTYQRQFFSSAGRLGWQLDALEDSIERMRKTPAFTDVLTTCIPNSYFLREMSSERKLFYPHN